MFPEFLKWLEKEGNVWATMESKGLSAVSKSPKPSTTLYSGMGSKPAFRGTCFNCNEPGYRAGDCPNVESAEFIPSWKKDGRGWKKRSNEVAA